MHKEIITKPRFNELAANTIHKFWVDLVANGIGQDIHIPIIVAKGAHPGPTLGVTAVVHGNELNGLSVVQRLMSQIETEELSGTIVAVPVMNVPSILRHERRFPDQEDLNRIFPGKPDGNESNIYAHRLMDRIISQLDYLIDLHTASFGRVNSYYIRADMSDPITKKMALLQDAEIILDAPGKDGTLRSAAMDIGVKAITVEVGDPNKFQKGMIRSGLGGIFNVLNDLKMIPGNIDKSELSSIMCPSSKWIYSDKGGILEVFPQVVDIVEEGEEIAVVRNVFGEKTKTYYAPYKGVVIGKHVHPINQTGGRIIHLGRLD